ncbi:MAG: hypothetical protein ACREXV_06715, partial [Polaromonas sp.]
PQMVNLASAPTACRPTVRVAPFSSTRFTMYITDARHFLDEKGAIGPQRGPAKAMAEFHASVIAYATDFDGTGVIAPTCFKCKKGPVEPIIAQDDAIYWSCSRCKAEGRISHWQGTLWDLSERGEPHG